MTSRIIFIIWRWKFHLKQSNTNIKETSVSTLLKDKSKFKILCQNKQDYILGFTKANSFYEQDSSGKYGKNIATNHYDIDDIIKGVKTLASNHQILLLCHRGNPDNLTKNFIVSKLGSVENIIVEDFGGGDGQIYKHLLGDNDFKESAIISDENGNVYVKNEAFDEVWKLFFLMELKKKIFELKEDLLINAYPHVFNPNNLSLINILNTKRNDITLKQRLINFMEDSREDDLSLDSEFNFKAYWKYINKLNEDSYSNLTKQFSNWIENKVTQISVIEIQKIRFDFDNLLNVIPAPIYE